MQPLKTQFTCETVMRCPLVVASLFFVVTLILCLRPAISVAAGNDTQPTAQSTESSTNSSPSYRLYFTSTAKDGIPSDESDSEFACSEQIYAVLEAENLPINEDYELLVVWKQPDGDISEKTNYSFAAFEETTRIWAWLRLSRGTGGTLMSIIDSSAGMTSFIGTWNITVHINNEVVANGSFDVVC